MAKSTQRVLSFLTPEQCESLGGIPGVAVQGIFTDDEFSVDGFRPNRVFVDFMHSVISAAGLSDSGLLRAAQHRKNGWIYVIDLRTPDGPQGNVPVEDIIGRFEARDGRLVPDSYQANPEHRVFTKNGPVKLPASLMDALVNAVAASK